MCPGHGADGECQEIGKKGEVEGGRGEEGCSRPCRVEKGVGSVQEVL